MRRYHSVIIDSAGNPVSGTTVTIKHKGTSTNATIYSDEGITAITNPVTTDSNGRFAFYVADGRYDLVVGSPVNVTITDISIVDPRRIFELTLNDDVWMGLVNAYYDRDAAQWKRNDTAKTAWALEFDRVGDVPKLQRAIAAANPITWINFGSLVTVLDKVTADTTVVNTTTETAVYTFSVPANILGTNRGLRLELILEYLNNSGAARNTSFRAKYGGTQFGGVITTARGISAARRVDIVSVALLGDGATNAQVGYIHHYAGSDAVITGADVSRAAASAVEADIMSAHTTLAIDSTAIQTLEVTVQHSFAHASLESKMVSARLLLLI